MARIAFVTDTSFPDLTEGDRLGVDALRPHGVVVEAAIWHDPAIDWTAFDLVVLRSTWDYHLRLAEFAAWLDALDAQQVQVCNPTDVIRWNMEKTYLSDLQDAGVTVLPSVWLPQGARADLADLLAEKGWTQAVIKPVVSANAHETLRAAGSDAAVVQPKFAELLQNGGVIVQEFAPEIQRHGEWSFMFFNGEYSHAAIKRPQAGDFRVQLDYGGGFAAIEAPPELVTQAAGVLEAIETELLYARVDAIERDGQLLLMELELIEPYLFLELDPAAPARFAEAIAARLQEKV
ncbi:MAG: hypothetical protein KIS85_01470 [Anaerolineales bacterium]|nr:hypothetical protein [Anaerolineales bacterium]